MIHNRDGKKGGEQSKKYKQTDVQHREREEEKKYTLMLLKKGSSWRVLTQAGTGLRAASC